MHNVLNGQKHLMLQLFQSESDDYETYNFNSFMAETSKSKDWFLYDNGVRHERVKGLNLN